MEMRRSRRQRKEPARLTYAVDKSREELNEEDQEEEISSVSSAYEEEYVAQENRSAGKVSKKRGKSNRNKRTGKRGSAEIRQRKKRRTRRAVFVDEEEDEVNEKDSKRQGNDENVLEDDQSIFEHPLTHLYAEVASEEASLEDSVQSFLDRYESATQDEANGIEKEGSPTDVLLEILTMSLISSTGSSLRRGNPKKIAEIVETNAAENGGSVDAETLVDAVCEDVIAPKRYPILAKKIFRNNFCNFWKQLVRMSSRSVLYQEGFLDTFVPWLVSCSSGALRSLRHTASLAVFSVASELLRTVEDLNKQLTIAKRRSDTEELKNKNRKSSKASRRQAKKRLDALRAEAKEIEDRASLLEKVVMNIFHGVFVHRSEDIDDAIRADAVACFGEWALLSPDLVLKNHVSLLPKQMSDFSSLVRLRATESITSLCLKLSDEDVQSMLKGFVGRKRQALLGLARDVDDRVCAAGISMITAMNRRGLLRSSSSASKSRKSPGKKSGGNNVEQFEGLLFEGNANVQRKAAKYLRRHVPNLGRSQVPQKQLSALLDIAEKYGSVGHVDFVTRAFDGEIEALTDCEAMTTLLLKDGSAAESDARAELLARLMLVSFVLLKERGDASTSRLRGERLKQATERVESFGLTLVREMPALLERYFADVRVLRQLVELPKRVDLETLADAQQKKKFVALIRALKKSFMSSSDEAVLASVSETLQVFSSSSNFSRRDEVTSMIGDIVGNLMSQFEASVASTADQTSSKAVSRRRKQSVDAAAKASSALALCVRRLQSLSRWIDVREWMPTGALDQFVDLLDAEVSTIENDGALVSSSSAAEILRDLPGLLVMWTSWIANAICSESFVLDGGAGVAVTVDGDDEAAALPDNVRSEMARVRDVVNRLRGFLVRILRKLTPTSEEEDRESASPRDDTIRNVVMAAFASLSDLRLLFSKSQISRKFANCAEAGAIAMTMTDEDVMTTAKASQYLIKSAGQIASREEEEEEEDEDDGEDSDDEDDAKAAVIAKRECEILKIMCVLSGPGLRIAKSVESAFLLSLLGECRTSRGDSTIEAWCKDMAKRDPFAYLATQLDTLKRKFCDCQIDRSDENLSSEECVNNYVRLLDLSKKLSRFYGVGSVPKNLVRAYLQLLEGGFRFAFDELPERLGFLDVLDYYVRVLSSADKSKAHRLFDDAVAKSGVRDFRERDDEADGVNQGVWQAFDSFKATVEQSKGAVSRDRKENEPPTTEASKKRRRRDAEEASTRRATEEPALDDDGGRKRKRSAGALRSALRLDNLSDDEA